MSDLPRGWELARLSDLGDEIRESVKPDPNISYELYSVPTYPTGKPELLRGSEIGSSKRAVRPGDVLLCKINPRIDRVWIVAEPAGIGPQIASPEYFIFRTADLQLARYLRWYFHSPDFRRWIELSVEGATGSHTRAKSRPILEQLVPVPPVGEQERIVVTIEEHLSRLDAAERAVLSTVARLRKLASRVKEAIITEAPLVSLADLAIDSRYGTSVKCDYTSSGPGVIRIPNIVDENVLTDDLKYATDPAGVSPEVLLREGDVVFVRTNGSRDLIGRAAVASGGAIGLGFASYLIRYRLRADVDPHYLSAAVSAPSIRRVLEHMAATTAGQYNLSISKLDTVLVPVPSLERQLHLVRARSEGLSAVQRLTNDLGVTEQRARCLRRSILNAAFSGGLVPQDPDDEPTSVLLERIRSERPKATPQARTRKEKAS